MLFTEFTACPGLEQTVLTFGCFAELPPNQQSFTLLIFGH